MKKKISSYLLRLRLSAILIFFFYSFLAISPVYASLFEPPVPNTPVNSAPISTGLLHERSVEKSLLTEKDPLFFLPLYNKFYNDDENTAVQTVILEAVGEGYEGMVAVGEVIRNRTQLFLADFKMVCLMPMQFSCWNDRDRAEQFLNEHRDYYFLALTAWRDSENSQLTKGATDYHADTIHPDWADDYYVTTQIGSHIFYVRQ